MTTGRPRDPEGRGRKTFIAVFACMAAGVILAGILYHRNFEAQYRAEAGRGLSAVAGLKSEEVDHYRRIQLEHAAIFVDNTAFYSLLRNYLADRRDKNLEGQLREWLAHISSSGSYDQVRILGARGAALLSFPASIPPLDPAVARQAVESIRTGRAEFTDFYREASDNTIHLAVTVPITDLKGKSRPLGVLVFRADPSKYLYPALQRWPVPSRTAETLLVRRAGGDALFLTPLRFREDAALNLRIPLNRTEVPAVRAVLGRTGVAEGIDYRGVTVLADTRPIPGSLWFLVTRIDLSEVAAPLRERLWKTILFTALLLIGAGIALALVWKQRSAGFYKERYAAAEALKESGEKVGLLLDSAAEGIYGIDLHGNCTLINKAGLLLLGYKSREELLGRNMHELIHAKYSDGAHFPVEQCRIYKAFIKAEGTHVDDEVFWRADGTSFAAEYWSYPQFKNGATVGAVVTFFDITERRKAGEELRKLSLAVMESPASVVITDAEGGIEYVNKRFTEVTGYSFEEVKGGNPRILKSGEQPPEVYRRFWRTISSGETWRGEFHNKRKNGELYWEAISVSPLRNPEGIITHYVAVKEDITARKKLETELRRTKEEAEAANRAKSTFLANMSHEIRTPMNAILGFSQLMRRDPAATPEQRQQLETINRSGEHLLALINDILEMSKAEAGRTTLNLSAFDLHAMAGDLEKMLRPRAEAKGLRLETELGAGLPRLVTGDEGKLRQILLNLLGNALKFTEKGAVILRLCVLPGAGPGFRLRAEVEDTGPGIDPRELGTLFRPFEQTQAGRAAGVGTGLGLAISREYARLMGGEVEVRSLPGQGSVFSLEIGLKEARQPAAVLKPRPLPRKKLKPGQPQCRVLVADDNKDNRELLARMLGPAGFEVRQAANGAQALAEFQAWRPQLILMDLKMPVMDGYEAIRRIRACAGGGETKILIVTASVFGEASRNVKGTGADDLLLKPFRDLELFEKIRSLLGAEYVCGEEAPVPPSGPADTGTLKPASAAGLPRELLSRLREAVKNGDFDLVAELAGEAEAHNTGLAGTLRGLAGEFDLRGILALLAKETPHDG